MSGDKVLFECRKPGGYVVRVTLAEFRGSRFLDFREWVEREGQPPLATRKGVTMPPEAREGLGAALIAASRENAFSGVPSGS